MFVAVLEMCIIIAAAVFLAMFYAIWHYRRDADHGTQFHRRAAVEWVWAAVPCMMLIACAVPAAKLILRHAKSPSPVESPLAK